jgi:outer membrane protein assembly factor BamD (BamD/ComL family)
MATETNYSPKLKETMEEIKVILKKYDMQAWPYYMNRTLQNT